MLVDTNLDNGATEIWLGTARDTTITDHAGPSLAWIKEDLLEERKKVRGPIRPSLKKGGVSRSSPDIHIDSRRPRRLFSAIFGCGTPASHPSRTCRAS
jgi:hypothetical protein